MRGISLLCVLLLVLAAYAASRSVNRTPVPNDVEEAIGKWKKLNKSSVMHLPGKNGKTTAALMTTTWSITYSDDDVIFYLFTNSNKSDTEGTVVSLDIQSLLSGGWNSSLPTKIIIHGFCDSITSRIFKAIKTAYLTTGNYNVLCVDWSALCPVLLYVSAVVNMKPTGRRVGQLIDFLVENDLAELSQIHLIGHSLGAHVAGIAGSSLSSGKVARVTGLDPALPLVGWMPDSYRISKTDAEVVDVIHTTGGTVGFADPLGHIDFYMNGGQHQPGCASVLLYICSHIRSYLYFAESIIDGIGYLSFYCTSETNAELGNCSSLVTATMGDKLNYSLEGSYYVRTNYTPPFNLAV